MERIQITSNIDLLTYPECGHDKFVIVQYCYGATEPAKQIRQMEVNADVMFIIADVITEIKNNQINAENEKEVDN